MVGFLAVGFVGSFNLGLVFFVKLWFFFFFLIPMVVICTKSQEIFDGYIVLLGIMGWFIYLWTWTEF